MRNYGTTLSLFYLDFPSKDVICTFNPSVLGDTHSGFTNITFSRKFVRAL